MKLFGVDFTSAPSKRKGITIASAELLDGDQTVLLVHSLQVLSDFDQFESWLVQPGPWIAGFDLPFSLPRELVEYLGWPTTWPELMMYLQMVSRAEMRNLFKAFCDARPVGNKFAHRATDIPANSSPSMKWVNPPVAYMLHAGAPRLLQAGMHLPGIYQPEHDAANCAAHSRIGLEAYPGMVARSVTRASYKSDDKRKHTWERRAAREEIISALESGDTPWKIRVDCGNFRSQLLDDGSGDYLDAVLCVVLAAWGWVRRDANFGLPEFDALEGWIVGA